MAKILVVDDDRDMTEACQLVLQQAGHEVKVAHNAEDGMTEVKDFRPDVLILDVMMAEPDDGIAMAQKLRRSGYESPILMLTSIGRVTGMKYERDSDVVPVDEFVEKPVAPATLLEKVSGLLSKKEGR